MATGRRSGGGLPAVAVAVAGVALAARLAVSLRGGGLHGVHAYDDGVYLAAATAFVHGRLPYADFLLLHPPGIVLALTPAALLGRVTDEPASVAAGRLAWMLLGAANAVLVARLAGRFGVPAALVAGLGYALWPPVVRAEVITRLEPLVTFLLLVGWLLLLSPRVVGSRWAQVAAGVALGLAPTVKGWALVPAAVVLVAAAAGRPARLGAAAVARVAGSAALAATAVCLPFLLAAPAAMVRTVVVAQVTRPENGPGAVRRWPSVLAAQSLLPGAGDPLLVAYAAAATALLGVLVLLALRAGGPPAAAGGRPGDRRAARTAVALLVVPLALVVASPSYFDFYAAFPAPALWVVAGAATAAAARWAPRATSVAAGLVVAGLAAAALPATSGRPFPADRLAPAAAAARCVTSDSPVGLLLLDVLGRDVAAGCPLLVDVTGLTYDTAALPPGPDGRAVPRPLNPRWQQAVMGYLSAGDAAILLRPASTGLSAANRRLVASWPVLAEADGYRLLAPR